MQSKFILMELHIHMLTNQFYVHIIPLISNRQKYEYPGRTHKNYQDRHGRFLAGKNHTVVAMMPPRSIPQNPGKIAVLPVLSLMAAL